MGLHKDKHNPVKLGIHNVFVSNLEAVIQILEKAVRQTCRLVKVQLTRESSCKVKFLFPNRTCIRYTV